MRTIYRVENIWFGGCAIEKALLKIKGMTGLVIDPATQKVMFKTVGFRTPVTT